MGRVRARVLARKPARGAMSRGGYEEQRSCCGQFDTNLTNMTIGQIGRGGHEEQRSCCGRFDTNFTTMTIGQIGRDGHEERRSSCGYFTARKRRRAQDTNLTTNLTNTLTSALVHGRLRASVVARKRAGVRTKRTVRRRVAHLRARRALDLTTNWTT